MKTYEFPLAVMVEIFEGPYGRDARVINLEAKRDDACTES